MEEHERELNSVVAEINKAAKDIQGASTVVRLLQKLQQKPPPTEQTLRATRAGLDIGRLRGEGYPKEIQRAAADLVAKWKKSVGKASAKEKALEKQKSTAQTGTKQIGTTTMSSSTTSSPMATPQSYSQPYTGDPNLRHFKIDRVDLERTNDKLRNNTIGVVYNGLAYRSTESIEAVVARAVECEQAAYDAYKGTTDAYRMKMRSLLSSLKGKDNKELGERVMSGELSAKQLVVMSKTELASAAQRARDEELEKDNMKKAQVPMAEKSVSSAFKCSKCGQRKVSYSQAQTRAADEPMTTFCECLVCGNRWKF